MPRTRVSTPELEQVLPVGSGTSFACCLVLGPRCCLKAQSRHSPFYPLLCLPSASEIEGLALLHRKDHGYCITLKKT